MEIKEIVVELERTQIVTLVISHENGFNMPKTANGLLEFCQAIKLAPTASIEESEWESCNATINTFDVIECEE